MSRSFYKQTVPPKFVIYVVYVWSARSAGWLLVAFVRTRRSMNLRKLAKVRERYTLAPGMTVRVVELLTAADCGGAGSPPPAQVTFNKRGKPIKGTDIMDLLRHPALLPPKKHLTHHTN